MTVHNINTFCHKSRVEIVKASNSSMCFFTFIYLLSLSLLFRNPGLTEKVNTYEYKAYQVLKMHFRFENSKERNMAEMTGTCSFFYCDA